MVPGDQRTARLIVLVGLVREPADKGEGTDLGCAHRQPTTRLRAQDEPAQTAECCAGAQLIVGDKLLQLRHQVFGCLSGGLVERVAGAGGIADAASAFLGALRGLAQDLAEDVGDPAAAGSALAAEALLQLAENVGQAAAAAVRARSSVGTRSDAARLARHEVAENVFQGIAAARGWCAAGTGARAAAASEQVAQDVA